MNDTAIIVTKASIVAIISLFFKGIWGLIIPLAALVVCMIIDYITGLMAAKYKNQQITSARSIKGIYKKCSMLILVVIGAIIDLLIIYMVQIAGFTLQFKCIFCCVICLWLVFNELISIVENLSNMDVNIPGFLMPFLKLVKNKTEQAVNIPDSEEKEKLS